MSKYHPLEELAPRDIVSRAIVNEMALNKSDYVYLDMTVIPGAEKRFPNIYRTCLQTGIDLTRDYVPVSPAAHYTMGGIATNTHGETDLYGLYACGEAACTGVHGANRLARIPAGGNCFRQRSLTMWRNLYRRRPEVKEIWKVLTGIAFFPPPLGIEPRGPGKSSAHYVGVCRHQTPRGGPQAGQSGNRATVQPACLWRGPTGLL